MALSPLADARARRAPAHGYGPLLPLLILLSTLLAGCAGWDGWGGLRDRLWPARSRQAEPLPADARIAAAVYYVGVDALTLYRVPGEQPVASLPRGERVVRTGLDRGYAFVRVESTAQEGWVDNGKLVWRRQEPPAEAETVAPTEPPLAPSTPSAEISPEETGPTFVPEPASSPGSPGSDAVAEAPVVSDSQAPAEAPAVPDSEAEADATSDPGSAPQAGTKAVEPSVFDAY